MGIITATINKTTRKADAKALEFSSLNPAEAKSAKLSEYRETDEEKAVTAMILKHFQLGYVTMYTPRVELDDLCVIERMQVDQMALNVYRPNNGEPLLGEAEAWKSQAVRPVIRNKAISICAHATAQLIYPAVTARDDNSDDQHDAALVMRNLMEYAGDQSGYGMYALRRTMAALSDPASIGYTEYAETYRTVKRPTAVKGVYAHEQMLDETLSGFQDAPVPCDELFIENFYENDLQKQGWLIWRRVIGYDLAQAKYGDCDNFQYVSPGIQLLYNDANQSFYQVYDTNMRGYDCEEVMYWNKRLDLKVVKVNNVFMTACDNPNPRNDKMYPFDKFGYQLINNRCFYYNSLVKVLGPEADIINTLYPMIVDGTYLNVMPSMIATGSDIITSSVITPGMVTTFTDAASDLRPINTANNLTAGYNALNDVQEKIGETAGDSSLDTTLVDSSNPTAYAISRVEAKAATVLGLFVKMIANHVKDYGTLRLGDIVQYLTLPEITKIEANVPLVYKSFLMRDKRETGRGRGKKIVFDPTIPLGPESHDDRLKRSVAILQEEKQKQMTIFKINPIFARNLKYETVITPDILNPMSFELERAYDLETYDRMIASPEADQEEAYRLLLSTNPKTRKDPDMYIVKSNPLASIPGAMGMNPMPGVTGAQDMATGGPAPAGGQAAAQTSPVAAASKRSLLPQSFSVGQVQ